MLSRCEDVDESAVGSTELDRDDFCGRHVKLFGRKGVHEFRGVVA
jgi:hypothetical protein